MRKEKRDARWRRHAKGDDRDKWSNIKETQRRRSTLHRARIRVALSHAERVSPSHGCTLRFPGPSCMNRGDRRSLKASEQAVRCRSYLMVGFVSYRLLSLRGPLSSLVKVSKWALGMSVCDKRCTRMLDVESPRSSLRHSQSFVSLPPREIKMFYNRC